MATSDLFRSFLITEDEGTIILALDNNIKIHKKNINTYPLNQVLPQAGSINGLALSDDGKELLACSTILNVYRHDGSLFALKQSVTLGFSCWSVHYIGAFIMVFGMSPQILLYEFNGTAYVPNLTINTVEAGIYQLDIYENGNKFMFGGYSQRISIYALKEGSYKLD